MVDELQDRRMRSIQQRAEMYLSELNRVGMRHAKAAHDTRRGVSLLEGRLSGGVMNGNEYTDLARLDIAHSLQSAHVQTMVKEHSEFVNALNKLQGCTSPDTCDAYIQDVINSSSVITPSRVEASVLMQRAQEYLVKSIAQLGVKNWRCEEGGVECLKRLMLELRRGGSTELLEKATRIKQRFDAVLGSIQEKERTASTIEGAETVLNALRVQVSELTTGNEARLNGILGQVKQELERAIENSRGSDVQVSEVRVKRAAYQAKVDELQTKMAELKKQAAECNETNAQLKKRVKELQASGSPEELKQCIQEDGLYIPACVNAQFHELQQKVGEIRAGVEESQELSRRINECAEKLQDEVEASQGLKVELAKSKKALEESIQQLKSCEAESKRCMDACKVPAVAEVTAVAGVTAPSAEDAIAKFRKMLAVGVPRPAVIAKMQQENLNPALLDKAAPAASEADPIAPYRKQLAVGTPRGAVEAKMIREGFDPALLDQAPPSGLPPPLSMPLGLPRPPGGLPPPPPPPPLPGVPRLPAQKAVPTSKALFTEAFAFLPETVQQLLTPEVSPEEIAAQKKEEEDTARLEGERAAQIAKVGLGRFKSVFTQAKDKDAKFYQQFEILLTKLFKGTASELVEWVKNLKFSPELMESVKDREKITLALNVFSELNKIATKDGVDTNEVNNIVETDADATTVNPYDKLLYMLILTRNLKTDKKSSIRVILDQLNAVEGMIRYTSQKSEFDKSRARFNNAVLNLESMVSNVLKAADCIYPKQRWTDFPLPVFASVKICTGNTIPPALKLGSPIDILSSSMTVKVSKPKNRQWLCPDGSFLQMLKGLWEVAHLTASVPLAWDWTLEKFPSWEELKDTDTAVGMRTSVSEMLNTITVVKAADASANLNLDALKEEYNGYINEIDKTEKRVTGMYSFKGNVYELVKKLLDIFTGFNSARSSALNTYVKNMKMFVQGNPPKPNEWYIIRKDAWDTVQAQVAQADKQQQEARQAASRAAKRK